MTDHNDEVLQHTIDRLKAALADWKAQHQDQAFTVQQVVADLTEDQRSVYVLAHSVDGEEIYLRNSFEEWRFDYDAFSRRDWSQALRQSIEGAE